MANFCETIFAQSELVVYNNFEMNYITYRRAWGGDAEAIEPELDASTAAAIATRAAMVEASSARAISAKLVATQASKGAQAEKRNRHWLL